MHLRKSAKGIINTIISRIRYRKIRKGNLSIVSNNCIAGLLYHHFGCRFSSPTINLQLSPEDYICFCEKLDHYCAVEMCESHSPADLSIFKSLGGSVIDFPVGRLEDLTVFFQHYKSFSEARDKWEERIKRINYHRLFLLLVDTNCSVETVQRFFTLPFKNKLFLTSRKELLINPLCVLIHGEPWFESDWMNVFNYKKWLENSFQ